MAKSRKKPVKVLPKTDSSDRPGPNAKTEERSASRQWIVVAITLLAVAGGWLWLVQFRSEVNTVAVSMPNLTKQAQAGQAAFVENCAQCHGQDGGGSGNGPPLIHKIYESSHHGDMAFHLAIQRGVQQHHWNFGNMPTIPDVEKREVDMIVTFVREVQRANGIF